jgi:hypothetical protein
MPDVAPSHLVITLAESDQDGRDLYSEPGLQCAVCGCTNQRACPGGCGWVLPGLCSACAPRVLSVTVAAPQKRGQTPAQGRLLEFAGAMPD